MQLQNFYAQDVNGNIVPGAICSLFLPGTTTLATGLVDVNGDPLANPFSANSNGLVQLAAPNGAYDLNIEAGLIVSTLPIVFADTLQALIQLGGFLPPSATPPTTRADGSPLQIGDRYMKTPEDIEYIYKTSGWEPNNLDGQLISQPGGAGLVGYGTQTVEQALNSLRSIVTYGAVEGVDCAAAIAAAYTETGSAWVPAGNFIATVTVANANTLLAALSSADITGNLSVSLGAGRFTRSAPFVLEKFPTGALKLEGYAVSNVAILGQVSVTGVAGAYDVVLQLDNAFGVEVGEALHTWTVVGTGSPQVHRGMWEITAVDTLNNRVTVRNSCWYPTFPVNTITTSNSAVIKSTFKFNDCDGFVVKSSRIDFLDKVGIFGNSDDYWLAADVNGTEKGTHGLYVGSMTIALNGKVDNTNRYGVSGAHVSCGPYVGINGFDQQGVCTELSASVWGDFLSSCNNKRRGAYASTASGIRSKHISVNGNFLDGAISDLGGSIYASSESCAVGNGRTGASSTQGGMIIFDTGYVHYNGAHGGSAVEGGVFQAVSASYKFNVLNGVFAEYGGVVYCNNSDMSNNGQNGRYASFGSDIRGNNCTVNNNGAFGTRVDEYSVLNDTGTTYSGNVSGDMNLGTAGMVRGATTLAGELYGEDLRLRNIATRNGVRWSSSSDGSTAFLQYDNAAGDSYTGGYVFANNSNGAYPIDDGVKVCGRPGNKWAALNSVIGTFTGPVRPGQYTLSTLPSASTFAGYEIDVTDATGGSKRCRSNGAVWQILNTTTTVS